MPRGSDCIEEFADSDSEGAVDSADEASQKYRGRRILRARRGRCASKCNSSSSSEEFELECMSDVPRQPSEDEGLLSLPKRVSMGLTGLDNDCCCCEQYGMSFNAQSEAARFFVGEEWGKSSELEAILESISMSDSSSSSTLSIESCSFDAGGKAKCLEARGEGRLRPRLRKARWAEVFITTGPANDLCASNSRIRRMKPSPASSTDLRRSVNAALCLRARWSVWGANWTPSIASGDSLGMPCSLSWGFLVENWNESDVEGSFVDLDQTECMTGRVWTGHGELATASSPDSISASPLGDYE